MNHYLDNLTSNHFKCQLTYCNLHYIFSSIEVKVSLTSIQTVSLKYCCDIIIYIVFMIKEKLHSSTVIMYYTLNFKNEQSIDIFL